MCYLTTALVVLFVRSKQKRKDATKVNMINLPDTTSQDKDQCTVQVPTPLYHQIFVFVLGNITYPSLEHIFGQKP